MTKLQLVLLYTSVTRELMMFNYAPSRPNSHLPIPSQSFGTDVLHGALHRLKQALATCSATMIELLVNCAAIAVCDFKKKEGTHASN